MRSISLGFSCNNACVFCAQGDWRDGRPTPTGRDVEAALAEALRADKAVAFQGGEPTLSLDLPRWVSRAKELGAEWVLVQTNGRRLVYADFAARLARAGLDAVDVSVHGSTPAMHDYHTQTPGSFLQTLGGIKGARAAGLRVGVTTVVTRSNFRHLAEIVRLASSHGASAVHLDIAAPRGKAEDSWERIVPAADMVRAHLKEAARLARAQGLEILAMGRATSAEAAKLFAGIGESLPSLRAGLDAPKPGAGPLVRAKPAAGQGETRGPTKKTGEALRELFPELFDSADAHG